MRSENRRTAGQEAREGSGAGSWQSQSLALFPPGHTVLLLILPETEQSSCGSRRGYEAMPLLHGVNEAIKLTVFCIQIGESARILAQKLLRLLPC